MEQHKARYDNMLHNIQGTYFIPEPKNYQTTPKEQPYQANKANYKPGKLATIKTIPKVDTNMPRFTQPKVQDMKPTQPNMDENELEKMINQAKEELKCKQSTQSHTQIHY